MSDNGFIEWVENQDEIELKAEWLEQESVLEFDDWLEERYASSYEEDVDMAYDRMREDRYEEAMKGDVERIAEEIREKANEEK